MTEANPISAALHTLSPCAVHYLQAQEAPFSLNTPVCIPDLHVLPSKKIKLITKFNFQTSATTGTGFVVICLQCKVNDNAPIRFSESAYLGDATTPIAVVGTGIANGDYTRLPYPSSAFNSNLQGRVVGVGLKVRYIGNELARSGQIIGLRHPDNETLVGLNHIQMADYQFAKSLPVTKEWVTVVYRPVRPQEFEYSSFSASADGGPSRWEMGFSVTGTSSATGAIGSAPFEAQVVLFHEYIGTVDNQTRSHSDVLGMSMIRNALPLMSAGKNMAHRMITSIRNVGTDILKHGSPALAQGVQNSLTHRALANHARATLAIEHKPTGKAAKRMAAPSKGTVMDTAVQKGIGIASQVLKRTFGNGLGGLLQKGMKLFSSFF